jgi:hypothetical protein
VVRVEKVVLVAEVVRQVLRWQVAPRVEVVPQAEAVLYILEG